MTETYSRDEVVFLEPKIMKLRDLAPILKHTITSTQGYQLEPRYSMENADEHLEGDPLKYSDIFERTMKYLERVSDWTPASVLYGKLLTAGYSPTAIKATLERLKHISNVGSTRQNGETAYHWYQRKEPFDTINQKAIDEWVD